MEGIILKMGGSVITDKSREFFARKDVINRLAREIAESGVKRLIIVHGGGSFGHVIAARYNYGKIPLTPMGFSIIDTTMKKLNMIIIKALLNHGLPALSLPPSSLIILRKGKIEKFFTDTIIKSLDHGIIPVLYGDVVIDIENGFKILSGDLLSLEIAKRLKMRQIIFCMDVDGIYSGNPRDPNSKKIDKLNVSKAMEIIEHTSKSYIDMTGGIGIKLKIALEAVKEGINVAFINGLKHGRLKKALMGNIIGTVIINEKF